MDQLTLFDAEESPPQAARLAGKLKALAEKDLYFGTSSWKYEGWLGEIYRKERYIERGKFSQKRFEAECLKEYAETFPIVGGDFSFYQFPERAFWDRLFKETPDRLMFGLKVPEEITVPVWPGHARYGRRAGAENPGFLDGALFRERLAEPLRPHHNRVATLMFEFGTIARSTFARPADFLARLDPFLGALPDGFRYAVEIRNAEYLGRDYFEVLKSHNVAHVISAWTRMPEPLDQVAMPGALTADFSVVRALLRKGRPYEKAVKSFSPYTRIQDQNPGVREAIRKVAERAWKARQPAYVFINNRLEGNAPSTIEAVADELSTF